MRRLAPLASAAMVLLVQVAPARASACKLGGWLGTNVGLKLRFDGSGEVHGVIGNEFGISPLGVAVPGGTCLRLGLGVKVAHDDRWRASAPVRLSLGGDWLESSIYLQAGPAFRMGVPGIDAEVGVDWVAAGLFAGTTRLPADDARGYSVVVGARVSLLAAGLFLFCTFNRCYTT